jgi:hypothetical protein
VSVSRDPARPSSAPRTLVAPLARGLDTRRCLAGTPPGHRISRHDADSLG